MTSTNAPERFLSWRFEDASSEAATRKLQYVPDSRKPNAGTFILAKEDHTLGGSDDAMSRSDDAMELCVYEYTA